MALVGDCARLLWPQLQPHAQAVLPRLLELCGEPRAAVVCSNAGWALGEIAVQVGAEMAPYVPAACARLGPLLQPGPRVKRAVVQNAAIALGRLAAGCAPPVATGLVEAGGHAALQAWATALGGVDEGEEKQQAVVGLRAVQGVVGGGAPH